MSKRFGFPSITSKLLAMYIAVFLPLMVFQYVSYCDQSRSNRAFARVIRVYTTRACNATLDDVFHDASRHLSVANYTLQHSSGGMSAEDVLKSITSNIPGIVAAGLIDDKGRMIHREPPFLSNKKEAALSNLSLRFSPAVSSVSSINDTPVFTVRIPSKLANGRPCYIYAVLSKTLIDQRIGRIVAKHSSAAILDRDGKAVALFGERLTDGIINDFKTALAGSPGRVEDVSESKKYLGCSTVNGLSGWRIAVFDSKPNPWTLGTAGNQLLWSLVLTLAAFVFFRSMGNRITVPVRKLSRAAAAIAVGDFRRRVGVSTGDELEALAKCFNNMANSLEQHEKDLRLQTSVHQSLFEITKAVTSSLDLNRVADSISTALEDIFGAQVAAVFRINASNGKLEPVIHRHSDPSSIPFSMSRVAERALSSSKTLLISAAVAYPDTRFPDGWVVALPLIADDCPIGVLAAIFSSEECVPKVGHGMELLETFASCAAIAVENAYVHGKTEEFTHALTSLRRVVKSLSSSLDLAQVLRSLVQITTEVMTAKACAIMLFDDDGNLSIAESYNLSESFCSKIKFKPGEGWTGKSVEENKPMVRYDLAAEPDHQFRELYEENDIHGFICAPLASGDEVIGTISVCMADAYEARPMEVYLLTSIASHAAAVILNAKHFGREYRIAQTLQSSLIGNIPDRLGRVVFGHKYLPALDEAQVGGDLYDVINLPNGRVGIIVADVAGKGIQAAMHTAMIRYMTMAFAYQSPDSPSRALELLNSALCSQNARSVIVTVFYAVLDPDTGWLVYANAGHPPAVNISRGGKQQTFLYRTGLPVGFVDDATYYDKEVQLLSGDTLMIYTDGVTEARQGTQIISRDMLTDILFENANLDPQEIVDNVCDEIRKFTCNKLKDDIAVIAVTLDPQLVCKF